MIHNANNKRNVNSFTETLYPVMFFTPKLLQ